MTDGPCDWDIMSKTSTYLQYPLAYLRYKSGWLTIDTIASDRTGLTLVPAADQPAGDQAYILKSPCPTRVLWWSIERPTAGAGQPGCKDSRHRPDRLSCKYGCGNLTNMGSEKGIVVFAENLSVLPKPKTLRIPFSAKEGRSSLAAKIWTRNQCTELLRRQEFGDRSQNIGSPGDTHILDVEFADVSDQEI